jgi:segregation and condensation protein B
MRTLQTRGLIAEVARDPGPGQASLYGTTSLLLERLGLNSIDELPNLAGFVPGPEIMDSLERSLRADRSGPAPDDPTPDDPAADQTATDIAAADIAAADIAAADATDDGSNDGTAGHDATWAADERPPADSPAGDLGHGLDAPR